MFLISQRYHSYGKIWIHYDKALLLSLKHDLGNVTAATFQHMFSITAFHVVSGVSYDHSH